MKDIVNLYTAITDDDLIQGDMVFIADGHCRRITNGDVKNGLISQEVYHSIDRSVKKGELSNLAGKDTVFPVQIAGRI
jgi:hypothetical protein